MRYDEKRNRAINQMMRGIAGRANNHNANSRAAARRRKQMVDGKLTPSNGVVVFTEEDEAAAHKALAAHFADGDSV